jgi:DNA-binding transcriptional MerR regulator
MPTPATSADELETQLLPIAAVERETGLGKDTLRVWERRYGFPQPERDANGNRAYPIEQVQRLRAIKRLLDQGMRPGKVFEMTAEDLEARVQRPASPSRDPLVIPKALKQHWEHLTQHHNSELRQLLSHDMARMGMAQFLDDVIAPLGALVGEGWARGDIQIFEEHLYTEIVTRVLRQGINTLQEQQTTGRPSILLTTLPGEAHGLGLLMAEVMLSMHGASCISLGTQTPTQDIAQAAAAHQVDVVALSISAYTGSRNVSQSLQVLLQSLAPEVGVWLGGSHPKLNSMRSDRVWVLRDLSDAHKAITRWQAKHLN